MLDWFKQAGAGPTTNAGIWHLYKRRYEDDGRNRTAFAEFGARMKTGGS
jgi:hypothetical protein